MLRRRARRAHLRGWAVAYSEYSGWVLESAVRQRCFRHVVIASCCYFVHRVVAAHQLEQSATAQRRTEARRQATKKRTTDPHGNARPTHIGVRQGSTPRVFAVCRSARSSRMACSCQVPNLPANALQTPCKVSANAPANTLQSAIDVDVPTIMKIPGLRTVLTFQAIVNETVDRESMRMPRVGPRPVGVGAHPPPWPVNATFSTHTVPRMPHAQPPSRQRPTGRVFTGPLGLGSAPTVQPRALCALLVRVCYTPRVGTSSAHVGSWYGVVG